MSVKHTGDNDIGVQCRSHHGADGGHHPADGWSGRRRAAVLRTGRAGGPGCIALTQSGGFALPGAGDVLIVGAAVLRALHVTVISRISAQRRLDPAAVTLVQLGTVAALTAMAGVLGQFSAVALMSGRDWALTAYLALVCTVFAFGVQMWAVRYSTPARMSLLLGTEPLWAVVIGVGLAGDPVTALGALGAALVLIGTNWGRIDDSATISMLDDGPAMPKPRGRHRACVDQQRCRMAALQRNVASSTSTFSLVFS